MPKNPKLSHLGFCVIRTPLLPFSTIDFMSHSGAAHDSSQEQCRIGTIVRDDAVISAIWLSSQGLAERVLSGEARDVANLKPKLINSIVNYIVRMSTRCTPFGLMAATSYAPIATNKVLAFSDKLHTSIEIDNELLQCLRSATVNECAITKNTDLKVTANSTWYILGGEIRFYEQRRVVDAVVGSAMAAITETPVITYVLENASHLINVGELAARAASRFGATEEVALQLIYELIASGVLFTNAEIMPTLAGDLDRLLEICRVTGSDKSELHKSITKITDIIKAFDRGTPASIVAELRAENEKFSSQIREKAKNLVQIDTFRTMVDEQSGVDERLINKLSRDLEVLLPSMRRSDPLYSALIREFEEKYGESEVSLLLALDPDKGLTRIAKSGFESALISDLPFLVGSSSTKASALSEFERLVLEKTAAASTSVELHLNISDIQGLVEPESTRFASANVGGTVAVSGFLSAPLTTESRLYLSGVWGSSALSVLGRFGFGNSEIDSELEKIARSEEEELIKAVVADIIFAPDGHVSNIVRRPAYSRFEIELSSGLSGLGFSGKIPANDLYLSVVRGRFILRSRSRDVCVIPRLSNAHNTQWPGAPIYKFLGLVGSGGYHFSSFKLGSLFNSFKHLKRIRYGSIVIFPETWVVSASAVDELKKLDSRAQQASLKKLLATLECNVSVVRHGDLDRVSHWNLDSAAQCNALIESFKRGQAVRLCEPVFGALVPAGQSTLANSPYLHEIILPLKRDAGLDDRSNNRPEWLSSEELDVANTHFPPFSEWLYYKVYVGESLADRLLIDFVDPFASHLLERKLSTSWFFIRYYDELGPHLRLRFHIASRAAGHQLNELVTDALNAQIREGIANSYCIDVYKREVRRYGGKALMGLCEKLFELSSKYVCEILRHLEASPSTHDRWHYMFNWIWRGLLDSGLSIHEVGLFSRACSNALKREISYSKRFERGVAIMTRRGFESIVAYMKSTEVEGVLPTGCFDLIVHRANVIAPLQLGVGRTRRPEVLQSLVHMDVNRSFRSDQRLHEMMLYRLLEKYAFHVGSTRAETI